MPFPSPSSPPISPPTLLLDFLKSETSHLQSLLNQQNHSLSVLENEKTQNLFILKSTLASLSSLSQSLQVSQSKRKKSSRRQFLLKSQNQILENKIVSLQDSLQNLTESQSILNSISKNEIQKLTQENQKLKDIQNSLKSEIQNLLN